MGRRRRKRVEEKTQITKTRNESRDITIEFIEIRKIIKNINNCLPPNNLEEMKKFLGKT